MTKRAKLTVKPTFDVPDVCSQLQELQRQRVCNLKSRIMIENRLKASVAISRGYHAGMEDAERKRRFEEAGEIIANVRAGTGSEAAGCRGLILAVDSSIQAFDAMVKGFEKAMEKLAKQLPVAAWVAAPEQRGFGLLSLAKVIGECGDLANYSNPGKVWKRMGCAPYESRGKSLMPSTWRNTKPGLSAEEWTEIGYSPRRRSLAYLIGEGLVKQNFVAGGDERCVETEDCRAAEGHEGNGAVGAGEPQRETDHGIACPYRARYNEAKAAAAVKHPEWTRCPKCSGAGANGKKCGNCKGTGKVAMHCHLHGMLLATKLLLRELWRAWNPGLVKTEEALAGEWHKR